MIHINNERCKNKIFAYLRTGNKDENQIKAELTNYIPTYMMPDDYFFVDHLPKNQNGKINRLRLKENF